MQRWFAASIFHVSSVQFCSAGNPIHVGSSSVLMTWPEMNLSYLILNVFTVSAFFTTSGNAFHGSTTLTLKKFSLNFNAFTIVGFTRFRNPVEMRVSAARLPSCASVNQALGSTHSVLQGGGIGKVRFWPFFWLILNVLTKCDPKNHFGGVELPSFMGLGWVK